jgi:hypothetical protein
LAHNGFWQHSKLHFSLYRDWSPDVFRQRDLASLDRPFIVSRESDGLLRSSRIFSVSSDSTFCDDQIMTMPIKSPKATRHGCSSPAFAEDVIRTVCLSFGR